MKPKSPEVIYAQTSAFIDAQSYDYKQTLGHNIGETATALLAGKSVTAQPSEGGIEKDAHVFTPKEYLEFLRGADPETRADIAFLAEKAGAYTYFKQEINGLLEGDDEGKHGKLLGQGSHVRGGLYVQVYQIDLDSRGYAVKVGGYAHAHSRAFRRGESIDNIAHLEAVDPENHITVMDRIPGKPMDALTFAERMVIPNKQIKVAIDTVIAMDRAELELDAHPGNMLYDSTSGFGFVDYEAKPLLEPWPNYKSRAHQVMALSNMFALHSLIDSNVPELGTPQFVDWELIKGEHTIQLLDRFLDVIEQDYPDILSEAVMQTEKPIGGSYIHLPQGEYLDNFQARLRSLGLENHTS